MSYFYTPWKSQKTKVFWRFLGVELGYWREKGYGPCPASMMKHIYIIYDPP